MSDQMRVIVSPPGRPEITAVCTAPPTWHEHEQGGWGEASIPCRLPAVPLARAPVRLEGGPAPWFGFVKDYDGKTLTCSGWVDFLSETPRRATLYSDRDLTRWRESGAINRNRDIALQTNGSKMSFVFQQGTTYPSGKGNGFIREIPKCDSLRVTVPWNRYNETDYRFILYSGTASPFSTGGDPFAWTAVWTKAVGAGTGESGTQVVDITGTDIVALRLLCLPAVNVTPGADTENYVANLTIEATSVRDATPDKVAAEIAAALPAALIPGGTEIAGDDTTDLTGFTQADYGTTEAQRVDDLLTKCRCLLRFEPKYVDGASRPCMVFRARPTTAAYTLDARSANVDASQLRPALDSMYYGVRVLYNDASGVQRYVDVTDTDDSHILVGMVAAGALPRWTTITYDGESSSGATAHGQSYLAVVGETQAEGTLTVTGGAAYAAGQLITVTGTDWGTLTTRIKEVTYTGTSSCVLTLGDTLTLEERMRDRTPTTKPLIQGLGKFRAPTRR